MMTPAPYTRSTLERIRNGARASDLGWCVDQYNRICDKHSIERIPDRVASVIAAPRITISSFSYDPATGIIMRGINSAGIIVAARQKDVFEFLLKHRDDERPLSSDVIIAATGECSHPHMNRTIGRLHERLAEVRCAIAATTGRHGGYRLVVEP